jgi:hypothetical protein
MLLIAAVTKLSRELRNEIYSYLTPIHSGYITINNTPLPPGNLALGPLVHEYYNFLSRLRANFSAPIRLSATGNNITPADRERDKIRSLHGLKKHLRNVNRITFLVDCGHLKFGSIFNAWGPSERHWSTLKRFVDHTFATPSNLESIRVAMTWNGWLRAFLLDGSLISAFSPAFSQQGCYFFYCAA